MNGDQTMREMGRNLAVPVFDHTSFTTPPAMRDATVAVVTSAALHHAHDERFSAGDTGYRFLSPATRDLVMGHWSPNFDHTGFQVDVNVVFPIDRLIELHSDGVIGGVAIAPCVLCWQSARRRRHHPLRQRPRAGSRTAATGSTSSSSHLFDRCARAP